MDERLDLERARLLLVWLQARRRVDAALSDLLAAGPAGERRVRARLDYVEDLERTAANAFASYCASAHADREHAPSGSEPSRLRPLRAIRASGTDV